MRSLIELSKPKQHLVVHILDTLLNTLGLIAIVSLVAKFGFYLKPQVSVFLYDSTRVIMWLFLAQEALRYLIVPGLVKQIKERWIETLITVITLVYLIFPAPLLFLIQLIIPGLRGSDITLFYLGGTQFLVLWAQMLRSFRHSSIFSSVKLHPSRLFLLSYLVLITIGTMALKLPKASTQSLSWADALFTATSAICITGLTTIDLATALTPLGQTIVGILFQVGGLGIMTFTMTFALFFSGGLGVMDRMFLSDIISEQRLGEIGKLLIQILLFTLTIEFFGAIALYYAKGGTFANFEVVTFYYAIFHAVSAFCHAGMTLFSAGLMDSTLIDNRQYQSVIMILVVVGSLGFPVIKNLYDIARRRRPMVKNLFMTVSTKLILISTAALLTIGTLMIWFAERGGHFSQLSTGEQFFQALFFSVTSRSSGFHIWPSEGLGIIATVTLMFLMWIGGSPMSTAGGIKNLTVMVAILNVRSALTGKPIQVFGRQISARSSMRAFAVITISILGILTSLLLLINFEPNLAVVDLAFETVSAWGNVGLSRGITPQLSDPSKILIASMMLIGRIGLLTFFMGFMRHQVETKYKLTEENILIT